MGSRKGDRLLRRTNDAVEPKSGHIWYLCQTRHLSATH